MKAKKCNRCNKNFNKNYREIEITYDLHPFGEDNKIDLCDECYLELIFWLKPYIDNVTKYYLKERGIK